MHNYIDSTQALPLGRMLQAGTFRPFSQHARLLGFMEQTTTFNSMNFNLSSYDPSNATAGSISVNSFLCPSDAGWAVPPGLILTGFNAAATNYRANEGTSVAMWYGADDPTNINNGITIPPNGLFYSDNLVTLADISDGTSNTAAFSEHRIGDFSNSVSTDPSDTYEPGTHPITSEDAYQQCLGTAILNLAQQGYSNVGAPWTYGYHSTTSYWHSGPPNSRSCMFPSSRISTTANSRHPGGVNVGFADGSVRFVKDTVGRPVWRALGTRNLGEIISADSY